MLCHSALIVKPPFVMCTESCNFTVFNTVQMPYRLGYKRVFSVLHPTAVEDMQLDVAGSGTQRLYHT